ncbi:MAG: tRNA (guanosine(37)-N1)-methyltransferase TrmD [Candidatus Liptonbacteria bacterium]|nr:tRNA (guanosine(37)-N1)-methyltransferase TrmD [Candidatus Liptonbacteria bacterium]
MNFDIITIFPHIFDSYLKESFLKRAQEKKLIAIKAHNLRDFAEARHTKARREPRRTVDDRPFGGGPGMVIKIEPVYKAVRFSKSKIKNQKSKSMVILFSLRCKRLDAKVSKRLAKYDQLILICGRYEGVDERVAEYVADEEISIGDYVLSGGELPALVLMESVCRFIPGFLGKHESLEEFNGSFPTYTRPETFSPSSPRMRGPRVKKPVPWSVPKVLLSGDHKKIEEWRKRAR